LSEHDYLPGDPFIYLGDIMIRCKMNYQRFKNEISKIKNENDKLKCKIFRCKKTEEIHVK